jgi:hypothetical protein
VCVCVCVCVFVVCGSNRARWRIVDEEDNLLYLKRFLKSPCRDKSTKTMGRSNQLYGKRQVIAEVVVCNALQELEGFHFYY